MLVSIVLPVYNCQDYVAEAINSILTQTYNNIELIIVNDCSTDSTELVLNQYANIDSRIKIISLTENVGISEALNIAVKNSTGQYIARMDADDISHRDRIRVQLKYLNQYGFDLVGCDYHIIDQFGLIISKCTGPRSIRLIKLLMGFQQPIGHPTWLMTRRAYDIVGGYRSCAPAEDYDFLIRSLKSGFKISTCPSFLFKYRISNNSVSSKSFFKQRRAFDFVKSNFGNEINSDAFIKFITKVRWYDFFFQKSLILQQKSALFFRERKYIAAYILAIFASLICPLVLKFNINIFAVKLIKKLYKDADENSIQIQPNQPLGS